MGILIILMTRQEHVRFPDFGLPFHVHKQLSKLWDTLRGAVNETMQFNLAHVFGRELLHLIDQNIHEEALLVELTNLMEHQIKVFAQEALGPSIHPPYHVAVNRKQWQQGHIALHDERYLQKNDMLEMSRMAVYTASNPREKKRYELETRQIEVGIYPWVKQSLQDSNTSILPASQDEQTWLSKALKNTAHAYIVGEKMAYFLPKNTIYAEDLAFINFCQLVYIPGNNEVTLSVAQIRERIQKGQYTGKISVVIEPVFGDLQNQDLANFVDHWQTSHSQKEKFPSTEEALMSQLHAVPEWAGVGVGREFILSTLTQVLESAHPILSQANERQQRVENIMEEQKWNIAHGAAFLAKILAAELATLSGLPPHKQKHFATQLPLRLHYAFGLVASPLLQRQSFDPVLSLAAYKKRFEHHAQTPLDPQQPIQVTQTMREMMSDPEWLRNSKQVRLDKTEQRKTTESLSNLPSYYLNRVVSNTACNLFSFGGYAQHMQMLNSPGALSIMRGGAVTDKSLWQAYYPDMELSGIGLCVNGDSCRVHQKSGGEVPQMLGPCGVCLACQMYDDMLNLGQDPDTAGQIADESFSQELFTGALSQTAKQMRGIIQPTDLLPNLFTPENKIQETSHQWR